MLNQLGSWDEVLPLMEFIYNNGFHATIRMTPHEVVYGRRCRNPLGWFQYGEAIVVKPKL